MNVKIKNMPRLTLANLLRRRKMTLNDFINESGVQTYAALVNRCARIGVQPPPEEEYKSLRPAVVTSQSDGVIVLEPPDVVENKKEEIPTKQHVLEDEQTQSRVTKNVRKKKKKETSVEDEK